MADLTDKQMMFAKEYLVDLNATQAAIRAGYSEKTAKEQAARLLTNVNVEKYIQEAMEKRSKKVEITAEMVLNRLWQIATADPRNLIEYWRCACRHCNGHLHEYQWIDEDEFNKAYMAAVKKQEEDPDEKVIIPDNLGGYGYTTISKPNPSCPKCHGQGYGQAAPKDTRDIDDQTLALYAGVKTTKDGIEFKMHDQTKALELVGKHLAMFTDKIAGPGANGEILHKEVDKAPVLSRDEWLIAHGIKAPK